MSIYDQIGAAPSVTAAVDRFYDKVPADPSLSGYFAGTDLGRLKGHQRAFISAALGGPDVYAGRDKAAAHAGLDITEGAFDAVVGQLVATLTELEAAGEVIEAVGAKLAPLAPQIVSARARPAAS